MNQLAKTKPANTNIVFLENDTFWSTSLMIAEKFKKRHDNVLRAIQKLDCSSEFNRLNFEGVDYVDAKGEKRLMYKISRDGFSILAMGFTGKVAMEWKEKFIQAFNAMEKELIKQTIQKQNEHWQQVRASGKVMRLELTDGIKEFVAYAKAQGSTNAERYYGNITKMEYKALFLMAEKIGDSFRDKLTTIKNMHLTSAETIAQKAISDGMKINMHYKDIYLLAKDRVEKFADMMEKTAVENINRLFC